MRRTFFFCSTRKCPFFYVTYYISIYNIVTATFWHIHLFRFQYRLSVMEHYYQFCINVQPLSNLSTMYPLYSATVLLPEITPFDPVHITKTALGTRFVNGCLKFSNLSNTRVQYVATCCRIGSDNRVCFFYQRPNLPLL